MEYRRVVTYINLLLVFSSLLPWLSISGVNLPGVALPGAVAASSKAASLASQALGSYMNVPPLGFKGVLAYLLYLVPILGGYLAARASYRGERQAGLPMLSVWVGGFTVVVLAVLYFVYRSILHQISGGEMAQAMALVRLGFGYWLTLAAGLALIGIPLFLPVAGNPPILTPERQQQWKAQAEQRLGQAKDWAEEKRQQVEASAEAARIQRALGKQTTRVILDAQDNVIVPAGQVVTHEAIEAARKADVLSMLLGSVDTEPLPSTANSQGQGNES